MYNSVIVGFLASIWDTFVKAYEYSLFNKITSKIGSFFAYLSSGSAVKNFFVKEESSLEHTIFYTIYSKLIDLYDLIWDKINEVMARAKDSSMICNIFESLFESKSSIIVSFSMLTFFFGNGIVLINGVTGRFTNLSTFFGISIALFSLFILSIGNNIGDIILESKIYSFIEYLFSTEEGGNQWW